MSNHAIGQKPATVNLNALRELDRNPMKRDLTAGAVATAATIGSKALQKSHSLAFTVGTGLAVNSARNFVNLIDGSEGWDTQSWVGNGAQLIGGGGLAIAALAGKGGEASAIAARPGLAMLAATGVGYSLIDRHLEGTHTMRGAVKGAFAGTTGMIIAETLEKGAIRAPKETLYATVIGAAVFGIAGYIQDKSEGKK